MRLPRGNPNPTVGNTSGEGRLSGDSADARITSSVIDSHSGVTCAYTDKRPAALKCTGIADAILCVLAHPRLSRGMSLRARLLNRYKPI